MGLSILPIYGTSGLRPAICCAMVLTAPFSATSRGIMRRYMPVMRTVRNHTPFLEVHAPTALVKELIQGRAYRRLLRS